MNMERISIDYAVMEKTEIDRVFPADFNWADIGNWESLYDYLAGADKDGNSVHSKHVLLQGNKDNIIFTDRKDKLLAISGLENYVIIDTGNVLMICPRDDRKLKDITTHIGLPEYEDFR